MPRDRLARLPDRISDLPPRPVYGYRFISGAHLDVESLPEEIGSGNQELAFVLDHVADIIRQPAIGKRNVRSAVDEYDFRVLVQPAQARRARSAARHATHDENSLS